MRSIICTLATLALLFVYCGAPQETPTEGAGEAAEKAQEIYYSAMSEPDLQRLIKVIPVFKAEVEKIEKDLEPYEGADRFKSWIGAYAALDKRLPGLDAKLTAAGMPWNEFWPAYSKTALAIGAVMMDSAAAVMQEQMKGQPREAVEQALSSLESARTVYKDVPQVNKDLVKKYMKDLASAFEMK